MQHQTQTYHFLIILINNGEKRKFQIGFFDLLIAFNIRSPLFMCKYFSVILTFRNLLEVMLVTYRSILISLDFSIVKIRAVNDRWDLSWNQPYANYVGAVFHLECRGFLKRNEMKNHKLIHIDLWLIWIYLCGWVYENIRNYESDMRICECDIFYGCLRAHLCI